MEPTRKVIAVNKGTFHNVLDPAISGITTSLLQKLPYRQQHRSILAALQHLKFQNTWLNKFLIKCHLPTAGLVGTVAIFHTKESWLSTNVCPSWHTTLFQYTGVLYMESAQYHRIDGERQRVVRTGPPQGHNREANKFLALMERQEGISIHPYEACQQECDER